MDTRVLMAVVFLAGLTTGWLGKTWVLPAQSGFVSLTTANATANEQNAVSHSESESLSVPDANKPALLSSNEFASGAQNSLNIQSQGERNSFNGNSAGVSITDSFKRLLRDRFYYDAMSVYEEQVQRNSSNAAVFKNILLEELNSLLKSRNNNDFSELVDSYLSFYYDDIDILLLLAKFNKSNGSYLEVVNVYLLAKTYAYTDVDQRKVDTHLNAFVEETDRYYTQQKDWLSLINLFSHIDTSGLMTSSHQYRQAIAHLRSGDEGFAIEQLNHLVNDSVVGESAAIALNSLTNAIEAPAEISSSIWDDADSIALEKAGNQFLVNMTDNGQGSVKLLVDTGASMTVVSIASFDSLNVNGDAIQQERRVFQTAGGVVMGTVYSMPELRLGPYLLKNTQVAVIDFGTDRNIDGLLGMNILGQFRFQLDQENSRLLLSEK